MAADGQLLQDPDAAVLAEAVVAVGGAVHAPFDVGLGELAAMPQQEVLVYWVQRVR